MADRTFNIDVLIRARNTASDALNDLAKDLQKAEDKLEKFNENLTKANQQADRSGKNLEKLADSSRNLNKSLQTTHGRQEKFSSLLKDMNNELTKVTAKLGKLDEGLSGVKVSSEGTVRSIRDIKEGLTDLGQTDVDLSHGFPDPEDIEKIKEKYENLLDARQKAQEEVVIRRGRVAEAEKDLVAKRERPDIDKEILDSARNEVAVRREQLKSSIRDLKIIEKNLTSTSREIEINVKIGDSVKQAKKAIEDIVFSLEKLEPARTAGRSALEEKLENVKARLEGLGLGREEVEAFTLDRQREAQRITQKKIEHREEEPIERLSVEDVKRSGSELQAQRTRLTQLRLQVQIARNEVKGLEGDLAREVDGARQKGIQLLIDSKKKELKDLIGQEADVNASIAHERGELTTIRQKTKADLEALNQKIVSTRESKPEQAKLLSQERENLIKVLEALNVTKKEIEEILQRSSGGDKRVRVTGPTTREVAIEQDILEAYKIDEIETRQARNRIRNIERLSDEEKSTYANRIVQLNKEQFERNKITSAMKEALEIDREHNRNLKKEESFSEIISRHSRGRSNRSESLRGLALSFQGYQIAFVIKYAQALLTSLTALAGELVAVAGAAISAGSALAIGLASGAAQAIGPVAILAATVGRIGAIGRVLNLRQQLQLKGSPAKAPGGDQEAAQAGRLADAQDKVKSAQEGVIDAQKGLTEARKKAIENLQELIDKENEAEIAAKRSSLSVEEAERALENARTTGGAAEVASAQLDLQSSRLDRNQAITGQRKATQDLTTRRRGGVEGDKDVISARRQLISANRQLANAERDLAQAQKGTASSAAGASVQEDRYHNMLSRLSGAERELLNRIIKLQSVFAKATRPITDIVIRSFSQAIDRIIPLFSDKKLLRAFTGMANAMAISIGMISTALVNLKGFTEIFAPSSSRNMIVLTSAFIKFTNAFLNIARAGQPIFKFLVDTVDKLSGKLLVVTSDSTRMGKFVNDSLGDLKAVFRLFSSIWNVFKAIFQPARAAGRTSISYLADELNKLAGFLSDNQKGVKEFFAQAHGVFKELLSIVITLTQAIFKAFNPGSIEAFAEILNQIVIPAIRDTIQIMGAITRILHEIAVLPGVSNIVKLSATMLLLGKAFLILQETFYKFEEIFTQVFRAFSPFAKAIVILTASLSALGFDFSSLNKILDNTSLIMGAISGYVGLRFIKWITTAIVALKELKAASAISGTAFGLKSLLSSMKGLGGLFGPLGIAASIAIGGLIGYLLSAKSAADKLKESIEKITDALGKEKEARDRLRTDTQDVRLQEIYERRDKRELERLRREAAQSKGPGGKRTTQEERDAIEEARINLARTRQALREARSRVPQDTQDVRTSTRRSDRRIADARENLTASNRAYEQYRRSLRTQPAGGRTIAPIPDLTKRLKQEKEFSDRITQTGRALTRRLRQEAEGTDDVNRKRKLLEDARQTEIQTLRSQARSIKLNEQLEIKNADTTQEKNRIKRKSSSDLGRIQSRLNVLLGDSNKKVDGGRVAALKTAPAITQLAGSWATLANAVIAVGTTITNVVNDVLQGLGVSPIKFKVDAKSLGKGAAIAANLFHLATGSGAATGGVIGGNNVIGNLGERGKDTVPVLLGRGEAVLNYAHQKVVEPALQKTYGFGLNEMFNRTNASHAGGKDEQVGFAKGGYSGPFGSLEGMNVIGNLARRFGLSVTAGKVGHSYLTKSGNVSDHSWGGALDVSNGIMTPQEWAFARFMMRRLKGLIKQLIFNNKVLAGGNLGSFVGGHQDHVHIAIFRQFAENAKMLAKIVSRALGGADVSDLIRSLGGSGGAVAPPKVRKPKISGPRGYATKILRAVRDKMHKAAQDKVDKEASKINADTSAPGAPDGSATNIKLLPAGKGRRVGATTFGGPGDPGTGSKGYKEDNLYKHPDSYAELNMGYSMGHLPYLHPLRVTANNKSAILRKRDIGAGGGPVGGLARVIDLWFQAAQALGLPGVWSGAVTIQNVGGSGRRAALGGYAKNLMRGFKAMAGGGYADNDSDVFDSLDFTDFLEMRKGGILPFLGKFANGTDKILRDGLAVLHKDEMVLPASVARKLRRIRETPPQQDGPPESQPTLSANLKGTKHISFADRIKSMYKEIDYLFPKNNILGEIAKRTYKNIERNLLQLDENFSNRKWDGIAKRLRMLTADDGPLTKLGEMVDEFSTRLETRRTQARYGYTTRRGRRGQRVISRTFERFDDVRESQLSANDSNRVLSARIQAQSYLERVDDSAGRAIRLYRRRDRNLHNQLNRLRKGGITDKEKKPAEAIIKQIKDTQEKGEQAQGARTKLKKLLEDSRTAVANAVKDAVENQRSYIEALISRNTDKYESSRSRIETGKKIGNLLGDSGRVMRSDDALISSYTNQAKDLRKLLHSGKVKDPKQKQELIDKIKELDLSILEAEKEKIQYLIDAVTKTAERKIEAANLLGRVADIWENSAVGAQQFSYGVRGRALTKEQNATRQERDSLFRLFLISKPGQDRNELEDKIQDLTVKIGELNVAIKNNTTAMLEAGYQAIQGTNQFVGNIIGSAQSFLNTLQELTGVDQTPKQLGLLNAQRGTLDSNRQNAQSTLASLLGYDPIGGLQGGDLFNKLLELSHADTSQMSPQQQELYRTLIQALGENQVAIIDNTKAIADLTKSNMQSFSSAAWRTFRQAIFDGSGGLLQQYSNSLQGLDTGGYVKRDGAFYLHAGEAVVPYNSNMNSTSNENNEYHVHVSNPSEVADPRYLANAFAFSLRKATR